MIAMMIMFVSSERLYRALTKRVWRLTVRVDDNEALPSDGRPNGASHEALPAE
jgi:hypothetical protein